LEALAKANPKNVEVFEALAQGYRGMGKAAEAERAEELAKALGEKKP
jgi:hypothetical protein